MTKVILGQYAIPSYEDGPTFFASDAFWEPDHGILGVATSTHHYNLYPIAERDVQAAIGFLHAALEQRDCAESSHDALLPCLLQAVHRGFNQIDMQAHLAGIEFHRSSAVPQPLDDPQSRPLVRIVVLQLQKRRLSIASVGNCLV